MELASLAAVVFGPFVNQHHFAAFMEMTSALAVSLLFGRTISREKKFLIGGCLLLSSLAVVLTSSRGGLMGLVAGSAFVLVISYFVRRRSGASSERRRFGRAASIAGAVAGLGFFVGLVIFLGGDEGLLRATGLAMSGDDPSNGRLHFWSIALKIFYEHPILGAGLDAFGVAFTRHDTWPGVFRIEQAHNDYLQTLADAGLAGFAAVAAFIFLLFRNGRQLISSERDDFRLRAAIGALGGCFAILLHSFFDFPLRTPSNAFFFLLLVVIATVNVPKKSSTAKSP
jgi:O-antigen ligase